MCISLRDCTGLILGLRPANGRRCYIVKTSLIDWAQAKIQPCCMMTSSNVFFVLLALCAGNSPVTGEFPYKALWREALMFSLICGRINGWANNREAGDLRRRRAHYAVIVMGIWELVQAHCLLFSSPGWNQLRFPPAPTRHNVSLRQRHSYKWINNFTPHLIGHRITYPYWGQSYPILVKGPPLAGLCLDVNTTFRELFRDTSGVFLVTKSAFCERLTIRYSYIIIIYSMNDDPQVNKKYWLRFPNTPSWWACYWNQQSERFLSI